MCISFCRDIELFNKDGGNGQGKVGFMRIFTDEFNIAPYLEGYLTNKDLWDDLRTRYISFDTLCAITTRKVDINWWKKQKSIEEAWGK